MILASQSPRRKQLLQMAGYDFKVVPAHIDEDNVPQLSIDEYPQYLAKQKAMVIKKQFPNELIIAADTIVVLKGRIINKPKDEDEAIRMLQDLSGNRHVVISGVCVSKGNKAIVFNDKTDVYFAKIDTSEIAHYVKKYKPFDKAGAYGVQEWMGLVGIEKIEGSHYNVMGLPVHKVYRAIRELSKH